MGGVGVVVGYGRCGCGGRICEDITLHGFWLCS